MDASAGLRRDLERYLAICEADPKPGPDTSTEHLAWMCRTALDGIGTYPDDKLARWGGYVRGCLTFAGLAASEPSQQISSTCPEAPSLLHRAHLVLLERYAGICLAHPDGEGPTSNAMLARLCSDSLRRLGTHPITDLSEAMGFVQGVLTCKGLVTVRGERDLSRPLFHAAYAETGRIPPTLGPPPAR